MEGALLGAIEAVWQALLLALLWAFELVFALLQALQAASGHVTRAHLTSTSTSGSNSSDAKRSPAADTKSDATRSQGAGAASQAAGDTVRCMAVVVAEDPACSMLQAGSTGVAAQLADIVQWCSEWGVEDLFLYDPAGQIKEGNAQLQRQLATSAALGLLQRPIHLQVGWGGHGPSPTVVEPSRSLDCGQSGAALETSTAATTTTVASTVSDCEAGTAGVDCQPPGEEDAGASILPESSVSSESAPAEAVAECDGGCWEEAGAKAGGSWQEAGAKLGNGCSSPAYAVSPGSLSDGHQDGAEGAAGSYGGCDAYVLDRDSEPCGCKAGVSCTAWQRHPPQQVEQPWHQEQHQHQRQQQQCQHQHQQGQQHEQRQQQQQQQRIHLSHSMCGELLCEGESTQGQGLGTGIASRCQSLQAAELAQTLEQADGPCICHTGEAPATRLAGCTQGTGVTPGECREAFAAGDAKQHSDCGRTGRGIAAGSTGAAGATASALAAVPVVAAATDGMAAGSSRPAQGLRETMHGQLGGRSSGSGCGDVSDLARGAAMRVYLLSARDAVAPILDVAALRGGADSGPKPGSGPSPGGYERLRQPGRSYREAGAELYRQMAAVAGPAVGREPSIVLVYGPLLTLAGYPPFHTRGSEIYHMGRLQAASRAAVRAALGRFARTEQRCGR